MPQKRSTRRAERRIDPRADARLSMRVEGALAESDDHAHIVTESQNISASGVYCHASHYLAPLSKVQITIILPRVPGGPANVQELLKCDGIVMRCEQRASDRNGTPYELACMFTALEPSARQRLEEFVTWRNLQALRAALSATPGRAVSERNGAARPALKPATTRKPATAAAKTSRPSARGGARSDGRARG